MSVSSTSQTAAMRRMASGTMRMLSPGRWLSQRTWSSKTSKHWWWPATQQPQRIDTIVLGCTHYPFEAQHIAAQVGAGVQLFSTGDAVARQTRQRLGLELSKQPPTSSIEFISTGNPGVLSHATSTWLGLNSGVQTLFI